MKIKAIAPWFGAKRKMAQIIVKALGPHSAYWEPFCGSMAVLFAKKPAAMETVCDLHGDLINLARVVQHDVYGVLLFRRMYRAMMSEALFKDAVNASAETGRLVAPETPDLDRACRFFLRSWIGLNGVAGTAAYNNTFCARFTNNGGHAATAFMSVVESIPDWYERLRSVTILNRDGFEVIDRIEDSPSVVIYCDPPYLVKGAKYVHDFAPDDHERLAVALRRFKKTRVVVSYYDHAWLKELYPAAAWTRVDCTMRKAIANQTATVAKDRKTAPEVLLVNGTGKGELFG